jgi:hypothetical protein
MKRRTLESLTTPMLKSTQLKDFTPAARAKAKAKEQVVAQVTGLCWLPVRPSAFNFGAVSAACPITAYIDSHDGDIQFINFADYAAGCNFGAD